MSHQPHWFVWKYHCVKTAVSSDRNMRAWDWCRLFATEEGIFVILTSSAAKRFRERILLLTLPVVSYSNHKAPPKLGSAFGSDWFLIWNRESLQMVHGVHSWISFFLDTWTKLGQYEIFMNAGLLVEACVERILPAKNAVCHASCLKFFEQNKNTLL